MSQATELVAKGVRLAQPPKCPNDIYSLMLRCWAQESAQRPTFAELVRHFSSSAEYDNVQSLVQHTAEEIPNESCLIETTTTDA